MGSKWPFDLGSVRQWVDVWQGEEDTLLPMKHAVRLAESLPNGQLRVVPRRGHFLLHREAELILRTIAA